MSSRFSMRPWRIDAVYLFDAADLLAQQHTHNVQIGVATSIRKSQWEAAEIFPEARNSLLSLSDTQKSLLNLFANPRRSDAGGEGSQTGITKE